MSITALSTPPAHIPMGKCTDRKLYVVQARNFHLGVYSEKEHTFYGIRHKWGMKFVDQEYHWDIGEPYGTVRPIHVLNLILPEHISLSVKDAHLFAWLSQRRAELEEAT